MFTYLKTFQALENVSLKNSPFKTVTLLCLVTGQRCQTIHTIDINMIQSLSDKMRITIHKPFKTTKSGKHQAPSELLHYPKEPKLCIVKTLSHYLERTKVLRGEHSALFISFHKPHNPLSEDTIARWVKVTLNYAGIDADISVRTAAGQHQHLKQNKQA